VLRGRREPPTGPSRLMEQRFGSEQRGLPSRLWPDRCLRCRPRARNRLHDLAFAIHDEFGDVITCLRNRIDPQTGPAAGWACIQANSL